MYITNYNSNSISVINGSSNTVLYTITVGSGPSGVSFDSGNGYVYVANAVSGSISIIATAKELAKYPVTFTESGLPSGTTWYVNLSNGQSFSSTTSAISFSEPNGSYSYTVSNVSGYSVSPSSGSIAVSGSSISKTITYTSTSAPPGKTPSSGIPNLELYGIIGAVIAIAAIGAGIVLYRKRK